MVDRQAVMDDGRFNADGALSFLLFEKNVVVLLSHVVLCPEDVLAGTPL
jgi:hypothetical protein